PLEDLREGGGPAEGTGLGRPERLGVGRRGLVHRGVAQDRLLARSGWRLEPPVLGVVVLDGRSGVAHGGGRYPGDRWRPPTGRGVQGGRPIHELGAPYGTNPPVRRGAAAAVLCAVAVLLGACGSSSPSGTASSTTAPITGLRPTAAQATACATSSP